jgi:hypothetical protein
MADRLTLAKMAKRLNQCSKTFRKTVEEKRVPFIPKGKRGMLFDPEATEAYLTTTIDAERSNVVTFRPTKRKRVAVVSKKFAEAV